MRDGNLWTQRASMILLYTGIDDSGLDSDDIVLLISNHEIIGGGISEALKNQKFLE